MCVIPVLVETVLIGCKGWTQLLCVLYLCWLKLFLSGAKVGHSYCVCYTRVG